MAHTSRLEGLQKYLAHLHSLPRVPFEPTHILFDGTSSGVLQIGSVAAPRGVTASDVDVQGPSLFVRPGDSLHVSLVLNSLYDYRTPLELQVAASALERTIVVESEVHRVHAVGVVHLVTTTTVSTHRPIVDISIHVPEEIPRGSLATINSVLVGGVAVPGFPVSVEVALGMCAPLTIECKFLEDEAIVSPCISTQASRGIVAF